MRHLKICVWFSTPKVILFALGVEFCTTNPFSSFFCSNKHIDAQPFEKFLKKTFKKIFFNPQKVPTFAPAKQQRRTLKVNIEVTGSKIS